MPPFLLDADFGSDVDDALELTEAEGAGDIGVAIRRAGIVWLWFPLESATLPGEDRDQEVQLFYKDVRAALESAAKIFIHCSAGIHRTGMITYGLLRRMGSSADEAMRVLNSLRAETGEGVGDHWIAWGDRFGGVRES